MTITMEDKNIKVENIANTITVTTTNNITACSKSTVPPGNYKLVGWDMDITGKKLSDEICQISGYTPTTQYSQYVMPYKDLTHTAKLRYALKVITITKYRMLKDTKSNKVIKTKSEVSALTEFITWLETIKDSSDGIILIYHEYRQILPAILLESLKKYYHLYDHFNKVVKGFVNGCDIAKANGKGTNNSFSIRTLAHNFFNKDFEDMELCSATTRAQLAFEIIEHLITTFDKNSVESKNIATIDSKFLYEYIRDYIQTIEQEEVIHAELKAVVQRENTLTPIFGALLHSRRERQQVTPLRRMLAEAEIDYNQLEQAWKDGKKDNIEKLVNEKIKNVTSKRLQKLLYIIECYFDEEMAEQLKLELEKKPKISKKKKRLVKKVDTTINIDSGNDSGDNTISLPTKIEMPDNGPIEIVAV